MDYTGPSSEYSILGPSSWSFLYMILLTCLKAIPADWNCLWQVLLKQRKYCFSIFKFHTSFQKFTKTNGRNLLYFSRQWMRLSSFSLPIHKWGSWWGHGLISDLVSQPGKVSKLEKRRSEKGVKMQGLGMNKPYRSEVLSCLYLNLINSDSTRLCCLPMALAHTQCACHKLTVISELVLHL